MANGITEYQLNAFKWNCVLGKIKKGSILRIQLGNENPQFLNAIFEGASRIPGQFSFTVRQLYSFEGAISADNNKIRLKDNIELIQRIATSLDEWEVDPLQLEQDQNSLQAPEEG